MNDPRGIGFQPMSSPACSRQDGEPLASEALVSRSTDSSEGFRPVSLKVTCLHIRHKLMYCDDRHAVRGMVDDSSTTRVFWCAKTQEALGPDGHATHPCDCTASRSCYCHGVPTSPPTDATAADQLA